MNATNILLTIMIVTLIANVFIGFQMRDRLEGILGELKKGKSS